jgi:hypothetical protein
MGGDIMFVEAALRHLGSGDQPKEDESRDKEVQP